ncbi:serine hydrolase [Bifidobacterium leontopitheci]|uniref:Serine hydrolase n=1 Tax=Bifidobacterium leontopitheci TaxID=2650774 RepID=A0A6I1GGY4_9BIFI|nr:serine hydrolase [Bifidobacterium leontopitheci]KAB7790910.1 serine hydrolase [Bifidobacterium leontopitheci]
MARHRAVRDAGRARRRHWIVAGLAAVLVVVLSATVGGLLGAGRFGGGQPADRPTPLATSGSGTSATTADGDHDAAAVPEPKTADDGDDSATAAAQQSAEAVKTAAGEARTAAVRKALDERLAGYAGTWSVTYIDLESGRETTVNDRKLVAASLVKLYIMLTVFDRIEHGAMQDDSTVDALLTQMITVSSNDAANGLLSRIGNGDDATAISTVTDTAHRYGFTSSDELRTLTGMASGNTVENWTSTRDCAGFLAQAYAGTLVSKDASARMMTLLLGQTRRSKIPAGVPAGTKVANKTGELAAVQNDAAVVYGPHPYVLTVMSNDVSADAAGLIADLSAAVWGASQG